MLKENSPSNLVIADQEEPVGIAGVMEVWIQKLQRKLPLYYWNQLILVANLSVNRQGTQSKDRGFFKI